MPVTIKAERCKGRDLKPGDLFSTYGASWWDHFGQNGAVGEQVYIRTDVPADNFEDADADIYRITVVRDDADLLASCKDMEMVYAEYMALRPDPNSKAFELVTEIVQKCRRAVARAELGTAAAPESPDWGRIVQELLDYITGGRNLTEEEANAEGETFARLYLGARAALDLLKRSK